MRSELRKPWLSVAGDALVVHVLRRFAEFEPTREMILDVHPGDLDRGEALRERFDGLKVTAGGETRVASVRAGLTLASDDVELVAVQDGVRPLLTEDLIRRTCAAAAEHGAAIPVVPVAATIKEVSSETIVRTVPREGLYEAQTPQVFRTELLRRGYAELADDNVTDDAQVVERLGERVAVVPGLVHNIKITTPEDLRLAKILLSV